jgi:hypothetical protein
MANTDGSFIIKVENDKSVWSCVEVVNVNKYEDVVNEYGNDTVMSSSAEKSMKALEKVYGKTAVKEASETVWTAMDVVKAEGKNSVTRDS